MRRPKEFNARAIRRLGWELERIHRLQEQILQCQEELNEISNKNSWMRDLGDEDKNCTEEQKIEIAKMVREIIYCND